jgi:hypothetical protein
MMSGGRGNVVEQFNLFGERDPFAELTENIVRWYEAAKADSEKYGGYMPNFDDWLRDNFSSYCGGNCTTFLYDKWTFYDFSPSGLRLTNMNKLVKVKNGTEWESIFFPKKKILKAFGIKDDNKDILRGEEQNDEID